MLLEHKDIEKCVSRFSMSISLCCCADWKPNNNSIWWRDRIL